MSALLAPAEPWPHEGAAAWWARFRELDDASATDAGIFADRVGYAFAGGYEAALTALVPGRDRSRAGALCVTEAGGNHPRAIATVAEGGALTGHKSFVTLGSLADELYVLAKEGESDGRPALGLYRVDARGPGVTIEAAPPAPFVPEIDHATLTLEGAAGERLEGDGWSDYVKPFRTVEDTHVHIALVAHLVAQGARWGWERALLEKGLALHASLLHVAGLEPSATETHLTLAGSIAVTAGFVDACEQQYWPADARERWDRDRGLLNVASKAREARRQKAWAALSG